MTYVDVLREKRREVLSDIEQLRAQASEIASRVAAKEGQLRNLEELLALEGGEPRLDGPESDVVARAPSTQAQRFTDAAVTLLTEQSVPLHYQEIARLLAERDVYIPGKDPGANLIAHMLRDSRFGRATGRGMYGLADWPAVVAAKAPSRSRTRSGSRRKPARRAPRTNAND